MSEFESQATELATEIALGQVEDGAHRHKTPTWHRLAALSTLLMALFTALGALLAGITAHEALLDRTQEAIDISIVENERVSIEVLSAKVDILESLGQPVDPVDLARIDAYEANIRAHQLEATQEETRVQALSFPHLTFALSVTILSVGITMSGMAVIVNGKYLWWTGILFGILGAIGVIVGLGVMLS